MGDVITRFKLETTQYDSKLRDSAKNLADLTKKLQIAGKDSERFAEKNVEAARSLGKIESGANNAKDKLRDLVSAYNNVAKAYNNLTKEQQATDYGKAMATSLDQLQQRITQTKDEIYSLGEKGKSTGGIMDTLSKKFTVNVDALQLLNIGLKASKAALGVVKDAFFASEQNLDDWNRAVYSAESVYQGFLTSLNTGDVSGFLNNINTIVLAAQEAYNAIDNLETLKNIQSPQQSKKQAEINRMENMLRTGRYIAPIDGRAPIKGMKTGDLLTQAQKDQIAKNLASAVNELAGFTKNEVQAANKAIEALYNEQALRLGMSKSAFLKGTSNRTIFDQNIEGARKYMEFEAAHTANVVIQSSAGAITKKQRDSVANPYEAYKGWSVFKDDGELYQKIIQMIAQKTGQESNYYAQVSKAYRGINRVENGGSGSGGGATGKTVEAQKLTDFTAQTIGTTQSMKELQAQLKRYQDMLANATDQFTAGTAQAGIAQTQRLIAAQPTALQMGISVEAAADTMEKVQSIRDQIQEELKNNPLYIQATMDTENLDEVSNAAKGVKINMKDAASMVNTLGNALSAIEDPGAKVAATVAQAIATIAMAYSDALAKDSSSKFNIWSFIAAAAAATVSMATTISSIHSATGYERGGVVQGNTYSNDQIPAMLNAGETVLTRAQAGVLSTILTDRQGGGGGASTPYVTGDKLILGINNYAKKQGWGELVFSRR